MKILIIDDHPLFLDGIKLLLKSLDKTVSILSAHTSEAAMSLIENNPDTDLVMLDLNLPDTNGLTLLHEIHKIQSNVPIVMLTASTRRTDMQKSLSTGAKGYICKSSSAPVIINAVNLVLAGGVYIPPEMVQETFHNSAKLSDDHESQNIETPELRLTPRQNQVLDLLIDGKGRSNKEIANIIGCSEATIKVHVTALLKAMNVTNRIQLQSAAKELGLMSNKRRSTDFIA